MQSTRKIIPVLFLSASVILVAVLMASSVLGQDTHPGITPQEAVTLRKQFKGPHDTFITSDGVTLFLRRWEPNRIEASTKDIAVLLFHGVTAHSGAYNRAGEPISKAGYQVFGLDYRGHGLSDGAGGDSPGKKRFIADLVEAVEHIKNLGFKRVVILGHSLGVASGLVVGKVIPDKIDGLILLSGAYEGRKTANPDIPFAQATKILGCYTVPPRSSGS